MLLIFYSTTHGQGRGRGGRSGEAAATEAASSTIVPSSGQGTHSPPACTMRQWVWATSRRRETKKKRKKSWRGSGRKTNAMSPSYVFSPPRTFVLGVFFSSSESDLLLENYGGHGDDEYDNDDDVTWRWWVSEGGTKGAARHSTRVMIQRPRLVVS